MNRTGAKMDVKVKIKREPFVCVTVFFLEFMCFLFSMTDGSHNNNKNLIFFFFCLLQTFGSANNYDIIYY